MICEFYPWKFETDVEETKKIYAKRDFSINTEWNEHLIQRLTEEQKNFFKSLGVDLMKIPVEEKIWEFDEDNENTNVFKISTDFAIRGRLIEIPEWQADIFTDTEILGELPQNISVVDGGEMIAYAIGNMKPGIVFKPTYFKVENENLRVWNSGYVIGSLLIIEE